MALIRIRFAQIKGKKIKVILCFANDTLKKRDQEIYLRNLTENLVLDQVHYTTDFDPERYQEAGYIIHYFVDESDEMVFKYPEGFHAKLKKMGKNDTIICLTATPCKTNEAESEK